MKSVRCEVCGRKIHSSPIRAEIDGAKLTVCVECSKHGKIISDEEIDFGQRTLKKRLTPIPFTQKKVEARVEITQEVVDGYHAKIRQAREKLGLSHE